MDDGFLDLTSGPGKQNIFKIVCGLACCFIAFNFVYYFVDAFFVSGVNAYMTAHHFINYEFGVIPRALYGATIGELTQVLPPAAYFLVWFVICLIPYIVYFYVYLRIRKNCRNIFFLDAMAAFALVLPTNYLPLSDFFRLDIVLLNLFLVGVWAVWNRHWSRLFLVPVIMIGSTLIHESAIFMFLPSLCGIAFFKAENKRDIVFTALLCCSVLLCCAIYLYTRQQFLKLDPVALDAFIQSRNRMPDLILGKEPLTLADHFLSVKSGYLAYTVKNLSFLWCMGVLFSIPFFAVSIGFILYYWRAIYNSNQERIFRWKLIFLFFTTLSNICLFIGCDYNRWVAAWLAVNIILLFLVLGDDRVNKLPAIPVKYKTFFYIILFIFLISGAGVCHTFSSFTNSCGTASGFVLKKIFTALCYK